MRPVWMTGPGTGIAAQVLRANGGPYGPFFRGTWIAVPVLQAEAIGRSCPASIPRHCVASQVSGREISAFEESVQTGPLQRASSDGVLSGRLLHGK